METEGEVSEVAIVRHVPDDFAALHMCNALLLNGGTPVSVTPDNVRDGYHVFGRVASTLIIDVVDLTYTELMDGTRDAYAR
jgi:hypothetical protein